MSIGDTNQSEHNCARDESDTGDELGSDAIPEAAIRDCLHEIVDPCSAATGSNLDIVEMGLLKSIDSTEDHVSIEMRLSSPMCHMVPYFHKEVEDRIGDLPGVDSVELETDAGFEWDESMMSEEARNRRQAVLDEHSSRYQSEQHKADSDSKV